MPVTVVILLTPELTVATAVLLLLQVPPVVVLLYNVVAPAQIELAPETTPGTGLIVTVVEIWQPVDKV